MEAPRKLSATNSSKWLEINEKKYCVKHLYSAAEIPDKLELCKQKLYQGNPFYIFEYFDVYYAVIEQKITDGNPINNLMRAFDIMFITVNQLRTNLTKLLKENQPLDAQERARYVELTKLCLFLLINIVRKIEENYVIFKRHQEPELWLEDGEEEEELKQQPPQEEQQQQCQQKHNEVAESKQSYDLKDCEKFTEWTFKRGKFLLQLYNIMQLPLEKLWHPGVVETNFVNSVCDACYIILGKLYMSELHPPVLDTIFLLLDVAIMRYDHAVNFPVNIIQVMRNTFYNGHFILYGLNVMHEKGKSVPTVMPILIREFLANLSTGKGFNRFSSNYTKFLIQLSGCTPQLFVPYLPNLCHELLSCKCDAMRSAVLYIFGEIVAYDKDDYEVKKEVLQEYIGYLFMHMRDISYQVRIEVLQIWTSLKVRRAVPLFIYTKVFAAAIERLDDRIASVRMPAMQLIMTFLEDNPFSLHSPLTELKKQFNEQVTKVDDLQTILLKEQNKSEDIEKKFSVITPELMPHIEKIVKNIQDQPLNTNVGFEQLIEQIPKMLEEKKYKELAMVLCTSGHGKSEIRKTLDFDKQCNYFLFLIKAYSLMGSDYKDSQKQLAEQVTIAQNLEFAIEFHEFLTQVMPKLMQNHLYKSLCNNMFDPVDMLHLENRIKQCLKEYAILNDINKAAARAKSKNGKNKVAASAPSSKKNVRTKKK